MNAGELIYAVASLVLILIQRHRVITLEKKLDIAIQIIIDDNNKTKETFAGRIGRNRQKIEMLAKAQGYKFVEDSEGSEHD